MTSSTGLMLDRNHIKICHFWYDFHVELVYGRLLGILFTLLILIRHIRY